jgi:hypothetical protein
LIGEYQPQVRTATGREASGTAKEGFYPSLLSHNEFYSLQASLNQRKKQKCRRGKDGVTCLFSGLLNDANGGSMVIKRQSRGNRACLSVLAGKRTFGQTYKMVDADFIETCLLSCLSEITESQMFPANGQENAIQAKQGAIKNHEANIATWMELATTSPNIAKLIVGSEAKIETLKEEIQAMQIKEVANQTDFLGETKTVIGMIQGLEGAELLDARTRLKGLIASMVETITIKVISMTKAEFTMTMKSGAVWQGDGLGSKAFTVGLAQMVA